MLRINKTSIILFTTEKNEGLFDSEIVCVQCQSCQRILWGKKYEKM